jgi:hypothetical protein
MTDYKYNKELLLNDYPQLKNALKGRFVSIDADYGYNGIPAVFIRSFLDDYLIKYKDYAIKTTGNITTYRFDINEIEDKDIESYFAY